jgi:pimeloyl-ACP methyl ester carboxylesterase
MAEGHLNMLNSFEEKRFRLKEAEIFARVGGSGPALVLLHGYPQTHFAWHLVAPLLAKHFTVVVPDLRGYGKSVGPDATLATKAIQSAAWPRTLSKSCQRWGIARFLSPGMTGVVVLPIEWPLTSLRG